MGKKLFKKTFELAPEGTHPAIITSVADLGIQIENWKGQERRKSKWGIGFELSGPKTSDGKPFSIATTVSDSLHPKSRLYPIIKATLGSVDNGLDMENILGKSVLITVEHTERDDKTWANVANVSGLPDGMTMEASDTPQLYFDLDEPDSAVYEKLPALFKKRIEARVETEHESTGDLPF